MTIYEHYILKAILRSSRIITGDWPKIDESMAIVSVFTSFTSKVYDTQGTASKIPFYPVHLLLDKD